MAMRFRTSILVAFSLSVFYFLFWRNDPSFENGSHAIDKLKGATNTYEQDLVDPAPLGDAAPGLTMAEDPVPENPVPITNPTSVGRLATEWASTGYTMVWGPSTSTFADVEVSTSASTLRGFSDFIHGTPKSSIIVPQATEAPKAAKLQAKFEKEYEVLGLKENAGAIYGNTLNHLLDAGSHAGFHAAALKKTNSWTPYSNTPPYTYSPYPDYNEMAWRDNNLGTYATCDGPEGEISEVPVFSGHPEAFAEPLVGSYVPLGIDSNLCFERATRLGAYGYQDEELPPLGTNFMEKRMDWNSINWRRLQEHCVEKNANRYSPVSAKSEGSSEQPLNSPPSDDGLETRRSTNIEDEAGELEGEPHRVPMPKIKIQEKSRTAVLLRSRTDKNYTENDLQNIRSIVTELSLRSGGEYTVYLLVHVTDSENPLWNDAHEEAVQEHVPQEFRDMSIFWNEAMMEKFYPTSADDEFSFPIEWLPVQRFAHDYPQYDFYWNWDLESRYTGHHYNLFEKLATFAKDQPRRGLWERNERFYIPSIHGPYHSKFRTTVEEISGLDTVWGAPKVTGVKPVGPVRPAMDPRDDNYDWGVGEEADYISLAPIFNPVNTSWSGRNDLRGYADTTTPRRATFGTNSRCSKKLLKTMDADIGRGNRIGSGMAPQTVALLHGLKAVFAPIPIFFDRAWSGKMLDNYLNPGPKGVSGSSIASPFSVESKHRFWGSTWYEKTAVPKRLYNTWMGWEFRGVGGAEWEKTHGRTCLPPMLLRPIENVVEPPPDHSSK